MLATEWTFAAISRPQTPRCGLLELPPELRDAIYELAVNCDKPLVTFRLDSFQKDSFTQATQPPLTRVSRQVRHESISIYYASNDFVLHTESPKADNAQHWLECNERYLLKLRRVSLWVRYANPTNHGTSSQGAMSIAMARDLTDGCWKVDDEWRWITVVRRPSALESDAEFLIRRLRTLLVNESTSHLSAEGFVDLMSALRMEYVTEKMT